MAFLVLAALLLAVVTLFLWRWWKRGTTNSTRMPLPPGPPPLPILGNLRDLTPGVPQWELFSRMSRKFGDVLHLNVIGQHIIVLSSLEAINDLFEKRSAIYSSRPRSTMINELMDMDWGLAVTPYEEQWRIVRKAFHQGFNVNNPRTFHDIQLGATHEFLRRILRDSGHLADHARHLFGRIIMKATYGIDVAERDDPFLYNAEQVNTSFSNAARPGRYLVDTIPILKYIPAWVPGAHFQRDALHARMASEKVLCLPFEVVKEREKRGEYAPSVVSTLLEAVVDSPLREQEESAIKRAAGIAYAAGSDTTVSAFRFFFLAMVLYPNVQRKAQAELERVVGYDRLPDFNDVDSLPYIVAVVKECLRWKMVLPLGLPHVTTEDDEYRGYHIPKGAIVFGNGYAILHDPARFPDPHEFRPERFLKADGQLNPDVFDPTEVCFGYGRRICPGRVFAQDSLFAVISSVLHIFDITHALDDQGRPIPVDSGVTDGIISFPKPYVCSVKSRGAPAEALIHRTEEL